MILVDGSLGEGGGQILRTTLSLSAVTGEPVTVSNIRAGRTKPGMRPQHLTVVNALAAVCGAKVSGAVEGGSKVEFVPGKIKDGNYHFNVGTAGSVTLVLSALLPALIKAAGPVNVVVSGGTDVEWSPPIDYFANVTLPILAKFGLDCKLNIIKRGYYPAGGGSVELRCNPSKLSPIELTERGKILGYFGVSHAHEDLARYKVVERQAKSARHALYDEFGVEAKIRREYCKTQSLGSGVVLWATAENTVLGGSCLGEEGFSSELVGGEAGGELAGAIKDEGALDKHMADQIIPYIALAGGRAKACEITTHAETNAAVVSLFGYDVKIENRLIISKVK